MPLKAQKGNQKTEAKEVEAKEVVVKENCPQCTKVVSEADAAIQCDICDKWWHIECQNVSEIEYDFIYEHKNFHWYCTVCNKNAMPFIKVLSSLRQKQEKLEEKQEKMEERQGKIEERQNKLEERQDTVQEEFQKMKDDISKLQTDHKQLQKNNLEVEKKVTDILEGKLSKGILERVGKEIENVRKCSGDDLSEVRQELETKLINKIDEKLEERVKKPSFAEIISKQVDNKMDTVSNDLNRVQQVIEETKKLADEEKDREGRSNNIIIYRIPECSTADGRVKHDKSFAIELFKEVLELDVEEEDMKSVFRLGKWDSNSTNRPLLIQFREKPTKNRIMETLFKLRNAPDKFKNLSITHDMTKSERIECKKLVEDAKKKESDEPQGEYIWRVRGLPGQLKLIKIRKH